MRTPQNVTEETDDSLEVVWTKAEKKKERNSVYKTACLTTCMPQ